jgi:hypothetical protein
MTEISIGTFLWIELVLSVLRSGKVMLRKKASPKSMPDHQHRRLWGMMNKELGNDTKNPSTMERENLKYVLKTVCRLYVDCRHISSQWGLRPEWRGGDSRVTQVPNVRLVRLVRTYPDYALLWGWQFSIMRGSGTLTASHPWNVVWATSQSPRGTRVTTRGPGLVFVLWCWYSLTPEDFFLLQLVAAISQPQIFRRKNSRGAAWPSTYLFSCRHKWARMLLLGFWNLCTTYQKRSSKSQDL